MTEAGAPDTVNAAPLFDADGSMTRSLVAIGLTEKMESTGIARVASEMLKMRDRVAALLVGD